MSLRKQTPSDFLKQIIGRPVVVKLNSGVDYRGVLACLDGYMNIALEQTEEYVNGQLKNKYGDAFIRGNNVMRNWGHCSPDPEPCCLEYSVLLSPQHIFLLLVAWKLEL
uniref:U6 snRNA-associated Sm-like protein LSm6 n=1 Tax=Piliocolobus tephrosceles TaxID=591936 RepID=A0A8C9LGM3_9PRIM